MKYKFSVNAVRWFDKKNGNTYHSVRIINLDNGSVITGNMQYGYGDHYRQTALEIMLKAGWIPEKYGIRQKNGMTNLYLFERENDYPILWNVYDGKKRDCKHNGEEI